VATIHLDAIRSNYAEAVLRAEGRSVIAVVKAEAYGHGAARVAHALVAAGCQRLAVATVEEGRALRDADVAVPILVLGGVHDAPLLAVEAGLTPVVHHGKQLETLAAAARSQHVQVPVHIEVDTAMHRMGVPAGEAVHLAEALAAEPALELEGLYTHFARADEQELGPTLAQLSRFREVLSALRDRGIEPHIIHCANSAGLLAGKPVLEALPEVNAVRPGLMLYGVRPADHLEASLQPAMTFETRVVHVRGVQAGDPVGYSALFRARRPTRIATLPVGYGDGVPVAASNRGAVCIGGERHPIVGRVSMDFITVDVGDAPVSIGDEAVLFGSGAAGTLPVEAAASAAETISYELLVRVSNRVPRSYEGA
jgi:alanine racemase